MRKEDQIYIVAGDEMQKLMKNKFPNIKTVPFREDLSKGTYKSFEIDKKFIAERASFWGVSESDYSEKMSPIIDLDISKSYLLCFGDDDCCAANLKFMLGYLKAKGYSKPVRVRIVNEYDLTVIEEYDV